MSHHALSVALWQPLALAVLLLVCGVARAESSQGFPIKKDGWGLSAYLIKPTEGMQDRLPAGWTRHTKLTFRNSTLADEYLEPGPQAAPAITTSHPLPQAAYRVSVLIRGKGKARLVGSAAWQAFDNQPGNFYAWAEVGTTGTVDRVSVEVVSEGALQAYGGLLAEGSVMPVLPVARVRERLTKGEPVTIAVLGDSVTENSGGTGGGASSFDTGNVGLLFHFLTSTFGETSYLTHRSPPDWPPPAGRKAQVDKIKRAMLDGVEYFDGRIEMDTTKKIRLVNLGIGGSTSSWGWGRLGDLLYDQDNLEATRRATLRFGLGHYRPDLVIINYGTNDVNGGKWSPEQYLFSLKTLVTNIQQRFGAAVILSTPHPWTNGVRLPDYYQPQMVDLLRAYCRETGLALADVYNEYGPGEYDGIHPGDAGHRHIADAYIKALLGQESKPRIVARTSAAKLKDQGDGTVIDEVSGLMWTKSADLGPGTRTAAETTAVIAAMNQKQAFGHDDWRLPSREELLGLVDPTERPAIPRGSPFIDVRGWCRSATEDWGVDMTTGVPWVQQAQSRAMTPGYIWAVRDVAKQILRKP